MALHLDLSWQLAIASACSGPGRSSAVTSYAAVGPPRLALGFAASPVSGQHWVDSLPGHSIRLRHQSRDT